MKTIVNRIEELIQSLDIKVSQFERDCGISNGTISKAIENETTLSDKTKEKIIKRFPGLSMEWLMHGKGEMFTKKYTPIASKDSFVSEEKTEYQTAPNNRTIQLEIENKLLRERIEEVERQLSEAWKQVGRLSK